MKPVFLTYVRTACTDERVPERLSVYGAQLTDLSAVVITSVFILDSRESNVTEHSTCFRWTSDAAHEAEEDYRERAVLTCVWPLWKRAEPWSGLKTSTSQEMLRRDVRSLPSHLSHSSVVRSTAGDTARTEADSHSASEISAHRRWSAPCASVRSISSPKRV